MIATGVLAIIVGIIAIAWPMELAGWSVTVGDPIRAVRGGIVSCRGLFARLSGAARVTRPRRCASSSCW